MPRFIALLRAINVGGHTVKMDQLRQLFESMGFTDVETFLASGNVVFESPSENTQALQDQIEASLGEALGYHVATFLRTEQELAAIARYMPFQQSDLDAATAFNIGFLAENLDGESRQKVMLLSTDIDTFHVHGREVYWLCRKKQSESTFSNAVLEKTLGSQSTLRGANTIQKMAEKYALPHNLRFHHGNTGPQKL